jgi:glycerol-3-phosphate acyltransferase PlsY
MANIVIAVAVSYLLGSIPTSYILAKTLRGIDIRKHGSGNVGATNLMRTVGKIPGVSALILDAAKGTLSVIFLPMIFYAQPTVFNEHLFRVVVGFAAVCGHIWSVYLRFKGGKGVATTIGVFLGITPFATISGLCLWCIIAYMTRYVSVASMVFAAALPISMLFFKSPIEYLLFSTLAACFILYKHIPNIKRLIKGEEHKIGKKIKS